MTFFPGGAGGWFDPTRGLDKIRDSLKDTDLKKQVKKPTTPDAAEEIIEGATHESIEEYVQSRRNRGQTSKPTGLLARLRSFLDHE